MLLIEKEVALNLIILIEEILFPSLLLVLASFWSKRYQ